MFLAWGGPPTAGEIHCTPLNRDDEEGR